MHTILKNLNILNTQIQNELKKNKNINKIPNIVAVSKTFPIEKIMPLIENNHIHFGENKVQEAILKWTNIKQKYKNIKLHLVGKLQTNKVKFAVQLFDYIHSLDNLKLANKISEIEKKLNKKTKIFIQVNIGNETQKNGIDKKNVLEFYNTCKDLNLDIVGTMCIPPDNNKTEFYFEQMNEINNRLNLNELSMGMSNDYLKAIHYSATFLRIGTNIFGKRN